MADYIDREQLLKTFKERHCKNCPSGYDWVKCDSWCDAADDLALIRNAPAVDIPARQWRDSRMYPPTEADADRAGGLIVWVAAAKHADVTFWQNVLLYPMDLPFWMPAHEPTELKENEK